MRRVLLALGALVAVWLVVCAFLFLRPRDDDPGRAAAVVVLAGDADRRIPRGLALVREGVAHRLVLSREPGEAWEDWRRLCARDSVLCVDARPYSTQGEAETVARLADRRGWRSLVIVTSHYHVLRARMLFRRCHSARVEAVGADYDLRWLPLILPLETVKLARAVTVERDC